MNPLDWILPHPSIIIFSFFLLEVGNCLKAHSQNVSTLSVGRGGRIGHKTMYCCLTGISIVCCLSWNSPILITFSIDLFVRRNKSQQTATHYSTGPISTTSDLPLQHPPFFFLGFSCTVGTSDYSKVQRLPGSTTFSSRETEGIIA